jgi:large subunit ribosomal protein L10
MAKTKQQKELDVKQLEDRLGKIKAVVFTNFEGLTVKEATDLRNELRQRGVEYTVVKKTLLKVALKQAGLDSISIDEYRGGLGMAFGYADEVGPARALYTFSKTHPTLKLIGGIYNRQSMSQAEVMQLATLPSKEELLSKLVWLVNYPMSGLVMVMSGVIKSFVYSLQAIKDKKTA